MKRISELDQVNSTISLQREKYLRAIKENQNLEKVKVIYLRIKGLKEKASELTKHADDKPDHA